MQRLGRFRKRHPHALGMRPFGRLGEDGRVDLGRPFPTVGQFQFDPHPADLEEIAAAVVDRKGVYHVQLGNHLRRQRHGRLAPRAVLFGTARTGQGPQRHSVQRPVADVLAPALQADAVIVNRAPLGSPQLFDAECRRRIGAVHEPQGHGLLVQTGRDHRPSRLDAHARPAGPIAR